LAISDIPLLIGFVGPQKRRRTPSGGLPLYLNCLKMRKIGKILFKTTFLMTFRTKQKSHQIVKKIFILGKICATEEAAQLLSSMKFFTG
jgi:hypothetical protein